MFGGGTGCAISVDAAIAVTIRSHPAGRMARHVNIAHRSDGTNRHMDKSIHVLRLQLEGRWYAEDLFACMDCLTTLYDLRLVLQAFRDGVVKPDKRTSKDRRRSNASLTDVNRRSGGDRRRPEATTDISRTPYLAPSLLVDHDQLSRLSRLLYPRVRLEIVRMDYASAGSLDIAGLDSVIGQVKDVIGHVIQHRSSERPQDVSPERAALEKRLMRSDNARQFVAQAGELGYSTEELQRLVRFVEAKQDAIVDVVEKQKLVSATVVAPGGSVTRD